MLWYPTAVHRYIAREMCGARGDRTELVAAQAVLCTLDWVQTAPEWLKAADRESGLDMDLFASMLDRVGTVLSLTRGEMMGKAHFLTPYSRELMTESLGRLLREGARKRHAAGQSGSGSGSEKTPSVDDDDMDTETRDKITAFTTHVIRTLIPVTVFPGESQQTAQ